MKYWWWQRGADYDATDTDGNTAFHKACQNGYGECVEILLRAGCDITAGGAPFH